MTRSVLSVLIIEDEPILAKNIANYLRRYGYEVHTASSAEVGLSELATFKPDAILLDFNLPGMNGVEALVKIRDIDLRIKVIVSALKTVEEPMTTLITRTLVSLSLIAAWNGNSNFTLRLLRD